MPPLFEDLVSPGHAERFSFQILAIHRAKSFTELDALGRSTTGEESPKWQMNGVRFHSDMRWSQLAERLAGRPRESRILTARETGVLRGIAQGLSDAEIAQSLAIARRTVCKHVESIYRKLGVETRTAAAQVYLRWS